MVPLGRERRTARFDTHMYSIQECILQAMPDANQQAVIPTTPAGRGSTPTGGRATTPTAGRKTTAGRAPTARRAATRARLLAAAEEVFAERGFHGASVEDLCERADFTRGAFYSNFSSKDELVLELYIQHAAVLRRRISDFAHQPGLSLEQVLEGVFDIWTDEPQRRHHWHLLTSEFALHALRDESARSAWSDLQRALRQELTALVEGIAAAQGLRLTVDAQELVRLLTVIFQGGLGQHLLDPEHVPAGSLERRFLPLLIAAVTKPAAAVSRR